MGAQRSAKTLTGGLGIPSWRWPRSSAMAPFFLIRNPQMFRIPNICLPQRFDAAGNGMRTSTVKLTIVNIAGDWY